MRRCLEPCAAQEAISLFPCADLYSLEEGGAVCGVTGSLHIGGQALLEQSMFLPFSWHPSSPKGQGAHPRGCVGSLQQPGGMALHGSLEGEAAIGVTR